MNPRRQVHRAKGAEWSSGRTSSASPVRFRQSAGVQRRKVQRLALTLSLEMMYTCHEG